MLIIKMKKKAEANPNEKMNLLYISLAVTHLIDVLFLMPLDFTSNFAQTLAYFYFLYKLYSFELTSHFKSLSTLVIVSKLYNLKEKN